MARAPQPAAGAASPTSAAVEEVAPAAQGWDEFALDPPERPICAVDAGALFGAVRVVGARRVFAFGPAIAALDAAA